MRIPVLRGLLSYGIFAAAATVAWAQYQTAEPAASVDLASDAGTALVHGVWRYANAKVIEAKFRAPDADGQPTGAEVVTNDIVPHAGAADFDDSKWEAIAPTSLSARRGNGLVSFNWYRIAITVPSQIEGFDPRGSTIWFETRLDDYAEVWVDGELGRAFGQQGGSVVAGWNAPNRRPTTSSSARQSSSSFGAVRHR